MLEAPYNHSNDEAASQALAAFYGLFGLEPVPRAGVLPLLNEEERCWTTQNGESWSR
jgi:hypothetical protein